MSQRAPLKNLIYWYIMYKAIKSTKGEYDILCLPLFRSYRFAGYKQLAWWIHNRLSKEVGKIITSCALWSDGKIILQLRKAGTTMQDNYMELTVVLYGD